MGGQGLPHMVMRAAYEYFYGANWAMVTYALEGHGTGKMIELFGTDKQKDAVFGKALHRPVGRDHGSHRTRGRVRRGRPDHLSQTAR